MSNPSDFVIENGVLKQYTGPGGDVVIPEGVTSIGEGAFSGCKSLASVTIPDGVTSIGDRALSWCSSLTSVTIPERVTSIGTGVFQCCRSLTSVTIPEGVTSIGDSAFDGCSSLTSVTIPDSVTSIGDSAFRYCDRLTSVVIPEGVTSIGNDAFYWCSSLKSVTIPACMTSIGHWAFYDCNKVTEVYAPFVPHAVLRENGLGMPAAGIFIERFAAYSDPAVAAEYISYISSQRKKLLPVILQKDAVELIRMLAEAKKITKKNVEQEYLLPAMQCGAEKCTAFLEELSESLTGKDKKAAPHSIKGRELWDGVHFSLDGKKLLKYPEEPGRTKYEVPEGTEEICNGAFRDTPLEEVVLPESVRIIRSQAFSVEYGGMPLLVRLPAWMTSYTSTVSPSAFLGFEIYVLTASKYIANELASGLSNSIYVGGPPDDLLVNARSRAVKGFLYAEEHGMTELDSWREDYLSYIRRNKKTYLKLAPKNEFLFRLLLNEGLLSEKDSDELMDQIGQGRPELTAALLEYKNTRFAEKEQRDELALSDSDPAFKRMAAMAVRQEEIRDQKGIRGLAFVATGCLEHFDHVDVYTGAHDLSDLKRYIEKRGGFLRSAVSSKTDYLISNDPTSNSVKSKKARELGVPVITEKEFMKMAEETE